MARRRLREPGSGLSPACGRFPTALTSGSWSAQDFADKGLSAGRHPRLVEHEPDRVADILVGQMRKAAFRGHRPLAVGDGLEESRHALAQPGLPCSRIVELRRFRHAAQVACEASALVDLLARRDIDGSGRGRDGLAREPAAPASEAAAVVRSWVQRPASWSRRRGPGPASARRGRRCVTGRPARSVRPRRQGCSASSRRPARRSSSQRSTWRTRTRSGESISRRTGARTRCQPCSRKPPGSFRPGRIWLQKAPVRDKCVSACRRRRPELRRPADRLRRESACSPAPGSTRVSLPKQAIPPIPAKGLGTASGSRPTLPCFDAGPRSCFARPLCPEGRCGTSPPVADSSARSSVG